MVKRYYIDKDADAHEHPDGYLVNYDDYAALEAAINEEPELPGEIPDELWEQICSAAGRGDKDLVTELLRIIVRQTKEGIKERATKYTADQPGGG